MNETENRGGAGPALAAHSKDASAPGQTPASATKGHNAPGDNSWSGTPDGNLGAITGRALDEGASFVREQPFIAAAAAGAICLALGLMLRRR